MRCEEKSRVAGGALPMVATTIKQPEKETALAPLTSPLLTCLKCKPPRISDFAFCKEELFVF